MRASDFGSSVGCLLAGATQSQQQATRALSSGVIKRQHVNLTAKLPRICSQPPTVPVRHQAPQPSVAHLLLVFVIYPRKQMRCGICAVWKEEVCVKVAVPSADAWSIGQ